MTKAQIISRIAKKTGAQKDEVSTVVEAFMVEIKEVLGEGENVYLRSFGSFIIKHKEAKKARNIKKNTTLVVPAHTIPDFKPSKFFKEKIKKNVLFQSKEERKEERKRKKLNELNNQ